MTRAQWLFGALVLAQVAHSVEEYFFELWTTLPPARMLSGLVSPDLERGFLVINIAIFIFGVWCVLWPVRRGWPSARTIMRGWVIVEIANGFVHPLWSMLNGIYVAGTGTAPFLLTIALLLAVELRHREPQRQSV
jgi:hypothetical protein